MSALLFKGLSEIHSWQGAAGSAAAVLAAYYVSGADTSGHPPLRSQCSPGRRCLNCCLRKALHNVMNPFVLSGIYHWGVDNYGDGSTPVVGSQIAAFQGHHQKPWTITEREFCNNVYKVRDTYL
jgi:hypothetical protein